jgi:hypothetical protein
LSSQFKNDPAANLLTCYNAENNVVIVDKNAPERYKGLAALCESINEGRLYEKWAKNPGQEQPLRCINVERAIMFALPNYDEQIQYLDWRIAMYGLLARINLTPSKTQHSAEVKSFLEEASVVRQELRANAI